MFEAEFAAGNVPDRGAVLAQSTKQMGEDEELALALALSAEAARPPASAPAAAAGPSNSRVSGAGSTAAAEPSTTAAPPAAAAAASPVSQNATGDQVWVLAWPCRIFFPPAYTSLVSRSG